MSDLTTASGTIAITETDEFSDIPAASKLAPPRPDGSRPHLLYGCMGLGGAWSDPEYTTEDIDVAWEALHAAASIGTTNPDRILACGDANQLESKLTRDEWYTLLTLARGANCP